MCRSAHFTSRWPANGLPHKLHLRTFILSRADQVWHCWEISRKVFNSSVQYAWTRSCWAGQPEFTKPICGVYWAAWLHLNRCTSNDWNCFASIQKFLVKLGQWFHKTRHKGCAGSGLPGWWCREKKICRPNYLWDNRPQSQYPTLVVTLPSFCDQLAWTASSTACCQPSRDWDYLFIAALKLCRPVQVKVTQRIQGYNEPQDIRRLKRGDYFGEKALLRLENNILLPSEFANSSFFPTKHWGFISNYAIISYLV